MTNFDRFHREAMGLGASVMFQIIQLTINVSGVLSPLAITNVAVTLYHIGTMHTYPFLSPLTRFFLTKDYLAPIFFSAGGVNAIAGVLFPL